MTEMKGCTAVSPVLTLTPSITHRAGSAWGGVCVCASCAFQLCARVHVRLRNQTVCERAAAPCLLPYAPIFSLRQSVKITGPPCVGAQTVYSCVREVHERACAFFRTNAVRLPIWRCYAVLLSQLSNGFNKLVVCCSVHAHTHTKLHTRHGPEYAHILTHG